MPRPSRSRSWMQTYVHERTHHLTCYCHSPIRFAPGYAPPLQPQTVVDAAASPLGDGADSGAGPDVGREFAYPDGDFHNWLKGVARVCTSKYVRDGRLQADDANEIYGKVTRKIFEAEVNFSREQPDRLILGAKVADRLYQMVSAYSKQYSRYE